MEIRKRPQTAVISTTVAPNPFNQSQQSAKSSGSATKQPKHLSYKDYTIREEQASTLKSQSSSTQKAKTQNVSELKTTVTTMRLTAQQHETAHEFKQAVTQKFNNFVQQQKRNMVDDDDSLLQDSQLSKTRDEKAIILADQKAKRKRDAHQKQKNDEEAARKKRAQLVALDKRQRLNMSKQTKRRLTSKSRERSTEKRQQKITAELVERHRPQHVGDGEELSEGAAAQLQDLRSWIEQQMHEEKLDVPDLQSSDTEPQTTTNKSKSSKTGNSTLLSNKEVGVTSEKQRVKLLKHQLPGNAMLSEKEDSKLGARQNRYGAFETGPDEFSKVVEIQRDKLAPKKPAPEVQSKFTAEQQAKGKEHVKQMIMQLAQRTGSMPFLEGQTIQKQVAKSQPPAKSISPKKDELSEDSLDKVPVRDNARGHRSIVNQKVKDSDQLAAHILPGVTETKKVQQSLDTAQKEKEGKAVLVIQKFLRGHWGRRKFSEQLYRRRHEIELEYGRFDRDYKQSQHYNIKNYLNDKQKLRKQTGLDSIVEDIAEVIGESSGSAHQVSMSMSHSLKQQNFFNVKPGKHTEFDPLSLISIYAKKNGRIPDEGGNKPSSKIKSTKGQQESKTQGKKTALQKSRHLQHSSSEIVEDIYSERFSEVPEEDISEDIPQVSSSAGSVPARNAAVKGNTKNHKKIIESDSIVDEVISAAISKSGGTEDDSIMDEASAAQDDSQAESDIMEDSIIRDEFASDNIKVSQAEKQLEARNRGRFGISSSATAQNLTTVQQKVLIQAEEEKSVSAVKHKNMVSELMQEMKSYESANINSNMMDRMEKIVISSLAQKDQIIMAQSLAELEREIRHKDEINRIREEQIRLMSQLMLLGGFGAGGNGTASSGSNPAADKQRQDLMINIQQMMAQTQMQISQQQAAPSSSVNFHPTQQFQAQQPDREQKVPMSHQQLYQEKQRKSMSYLDEYDQSKKSSNKFTPGQFKDIGESQDYNEKAKPKRQVSQSSIIEDSIIEDNDDIDDDVGSVQEDIQEDADSIGEDIMESYVSMSQSTSGFEELKKRQLKLVKEQKVTADNFSTQIEQAIDREKDTKEQRLNQKLRSRKISPRTFSRQRSDLESWATRQRKDLRDQHRKLTVEQQIADQQAKMVSDAKAYKNLNQVGSAGRLVDDSADSDAVKMALNQAHLLEKGLIGQTQDQKYIQRKKEAADRLMKEKERAIDEQLKSKMRSFEKEQADENLQRALELDVDTEVQRRFEAVKRQLEESQGLESARSAISQSRDSTRVKKNVKFADAPGPAPVQLQQQQPQKQQPPNTYQNRIPQHQKSPSHDRSLDSSNGGIEESIQESIGDSYSQSFKSQSMTEQSKSKSDRLAAKPIIPFKEAPKAQTLTAAKGNMDQSNSIADMVSDAYSEGFDQSSDGQLESQKFSTSKNKLQNKARDLGQSEQYSDDDFEESIGQSQQIPTNLVQDKTPKMESVKEESVDMTSKEESQEQSPEQTSLPSEDISVQNSIQSVDWQIQVPQESARTAQDYSQDNFDESQQKDSIREEEESSINDRLDQEESENQYESNPDDIGVSASASKSVDDIFSKADKIAQELLDLILAEYKGDNTYLVSCETKQIDEDEFLDKFPYTLDVKEPEIVIRPPSPTTIEITQKTATKPAPKVRSAKDIADEAYQKKHGLEQTHLKQQQARVKEYLEFLIKRVDVNQLIDSLDTPIQQNPLQVLAQIQAYDDEEPPLVAEEPEHQQILTQAFFNKIDREYFSVKRLTKDTKSIDLTASQEETEKIQNVHNYALFEALNEALDQRRPYKNRGGPMPWSKNTRVVKQATTLTEAREILDTAMSKVLEWAVTGAGSKYAPLPPPPTQTQDEYGDDIIQPPLQEGEEERKNQHRQEKLGQLMTQDIHETDMLWTDYEVEDTQARFDLADMILADLAAEIAELLM